MNAETTVETVAAGRPTYRFVVDLSSRFEVCASLLNPSLSPAAEKGGTHITASMLL